MTQGIHMDWNQVIAIIVPLGAMISWGWSRIDKKFDAVDKRFDAVDKRFDKLDEKVTDVDRRLCRLEGAFSSKDCCVIKDDRQIKKAE